VPRSRFARPGRSGRVLCR